MVNVVISKNNKWHHLIKQTWLQQEVATLVEFSEITWLKTIGKTQEIE